jgi:hypothetical protein
MCANTQLDHYVKYPLLTGAGIATGYGLDDRVVGVRGPVG